VLGGRIQETKKRHKHKIKNMNKKNKRKEKYQPIPNKRPVK
jgi:hypothetical protein